MKRLLLSVLLLPLLAVSAGGARQEPGAPVIVGGDSDFAPFEYLDREGTSRGFDIDILTAVAGVMGMKIEVRLGPWEKVRRDLEGGRIDALVGMRYSPERDTLLDFSTPYLVNTSTIFVRKDSTVYSLEDLRGKEIIVQRGDIMDDLVQEANLAANIVFVTDQKEALELLASGKHDAALASRLRGLYLTHQLGLSNVRATGVDFGGGPYGFAVAEGNDRLLARLNEGLRILKATGQYEKIYQRWFGLYEKKSIWDELIRYAVWVLTPILFLLATAFVWSWSLRRQVAAKTRELAEQLSRRQQAEAALEAERTFRQFVESSPVPMAITDETQTIHYVNRKFTELFGYGREELPDMETWWALACPDPSGRQALRESWRELVASAGSSSRELDITARDGALRHIVCRSSLIEDRRVVVFNDVTERKRAEDALAYRSGVEALISTISARFVNLVPEEVDRAIDQALEEIGEHIGVDRSYVFQFSEDGTRMNNTHEWCAPSVEPQIARRQGLPTERLPWFMKQLTEHEVFHCPSVARLGPEARPEKEGWEREGIRSLITVPMLLKGRIVGFVGFDSVRSEKAWPDSVPFLLRIAGESFANALDRRRIEDELRAAHREMEAFVYTVSHDLRSPLTPIIGYADFLREICRESLDEQALGCLAQISESAGKMLELMEDLLSLARLGKLERPAEPTDVAAVVREVVENLASHIAASGLAVEVGSLPRLRVPRTILSQIFGNLIGNAARYAGPGGGPIEVGGERSGDVVRFQIRDHGPGVPVAERNRIFEAFYRGSTGSKTEGTGLGLAVVQKCARLYGGGVGVEDTPGGGATFRVEMRDA